MLDIFSVGIAACRKFENHGARHKSRGEAVMRYIEMELPAGLQREAGYLYSGRGNRHPQPKR